MDTATNDSRIEAFRVMLQRLATINCQLQTLAHTLARAEEIPGLIARTSYPTERQWLIEEQTAIEHPLRQGWFAIGDLLRAALDAAGQLVTTTAGDPNAAQALPVARINLEQLAQHRNLPSLTGTPESRMARLRTAWRDIDTAMACLGEIRFEARQRGH